MDVQTATDYIVQLEEKCYQSNQACIEILHTMRETIQVQKREFEERFAQEVETLKLYILDLKSRLNNYVPVKGDELDTKLGEFINGYKQKQQLKLMFLRLSEGTYEFGTR